VITWLFVPGNRPERFDKARAAGADEVICDLEDAVPVEAKTAARASVAHWLSTDGRGWVRVNAVETPWYEEDIDALVGLPGLRGFVVPKAESPEALLALGARSAVIALIETALGVHRAFEVAAGPAVHRLAFGSIDFAADIDAAENDTALLMARSTLVLASRVAGKPAPIDGVTQALTDVALIRADAVRARELGFGGKLCVHPAQIAPVAEAFRPNPDQIARARTTLAAAGADAGASGVHGLMVDKPVLDRARRILAAVDEETHAPA
jgi:citrate lyase subunit beta/citryl-CoA lyase